jgi:hypothetical protein
MKEKDNLSSRLDTNPVRSDTEMVPAKSETDMAVAYLNDLSKKGAKSETEMAVAYFNDRSMKEIQPSLTDSSTSEKKKKVTVLFSNLEFALTMVGGLVMLIAIYIIGLMTALNNDLGIESLLENTPDRSLPSQSSLP